MASKTTKKNNNYYKFQMQNKQHKVKTTTKFKIKKYRALWLKPVSLYNGAHESSMMQALSAHQQFELVTQ